MRTFFLSLAGAFAALILFGFLLFIMFFSLLAAAGSEDPQPSKIVLNVDLRAETTDQASTSGLFALSPQPGFIDLMARLDAAERDDAVKGVFVRGSEFGYGSARAEELRDALLDLRAAGKFVVAHSQGVWSTGPGAIRAMSAADEIWMQQGTDLMTSGVSMEGIFLKDLLDNLSITAEYDGLYEYKGAASTYNETDFPDPVRENLTTMVESIWRTSIADVAQDLEVSPAAAEALLSGGPYSAEEAQRIGLIDELGWPEEALEAALERGGDAEAVNIRDYDPPAVRARAPVIAVVGGEGGITTGGGSSGGPFGEDARFASDPVAAAILAAGRNEDVRAVVFRVESPGGSPTGSDQIWRAVDRVRNEMDKPVVVSMGSVAASGGYFVVAGANHIVANRTTITGSIGIVGGKIAVAEGLERIGVNASTISVGGDFADALSADRFTPDQRQAFRDLLQRGYDRFADVVQEGRGFSDAELDEIARGRVWSGEDALEIGLVDSLGGFVDAVEVAKTLIDLDGDAEVRLMPFPAPKTGFEALEGLLGASAQSAEAVAALSALANDNRFQALLSHSATLSDSRPRATLPLLIER